MCIEDLYASRNTTAYKSLHRITLKSAFPFFPLCLRRLWAFSPSHTVVHTQMNCIAGSL